MIAARMMTGTVQAVRLNSLWMSCSIVFSGCCCCSGCWWLLRLYFQSQAADADNFHGVARFDWHLAYRVPVLALNENLAGARVNARQGGRGLAQEDFTADAHGQKLRSETRADDEDEERRRHERGGNDIDQRELEGGVGAVEEHQGAQ